MTLAPPAASAADAERDSLRRTALTLQRSLLPAQVPSTDELEVAARYSAGAGDCEVGGDWYDVVALGAGRLGIVVGDGRGRIELRLRLTRDRLVLESVDEGQHMPRRRRAGDDEEGGRGLHLVATLADRWGFRAIDDGKVVWAEVDLA